MLLDGIPNNLRANVPSHSAKFTHLHTILEYAERWGYIEECQDDALVIVANNALSLVKGTSRGKEIEEWIDAKNDGKGSSGNSGDFEEEEEEKRLLELRKTLKRKLHPLHMRRASMGIDTPSHVLIEIEDTEKEIAEIESKLKEMGRL